MSGYNKENPSPKGRVVDFDEIDPENAKLRRKKKLKSSAKKGGYAALGLIKTLIYVAAIVIVAAILSVNIISIVNDVYAFDEIGTDDDKTVALTFEDDEGRSFDVEFQKSNRFFCVDEDDEVKINHSNAKEYIGKTFDLERDGVAEGAKNAVLRSVVVYMEKTITFEENTSLKEAAAILKKEGLIDHPFVFRKYAERQYKNSEYYSGEIKEDTVSFKYTFYDSTDENTGNAPGNYLALSKREDESRKPLNYDRIVSIISVSTYKARETVRITIPEGFTVDEIIELLTSNGVGKREVFIDVIQNYDYNYRFVKDINASPDRKYRLEGYLFPDTYEFFTDESEVSVINKMLMNFDSKFDDIYYEHAADLGMSVDQVIILASILEKEAKNPADLPKMSSVFHNRLKASMRLDSDATVMYLLDERKTSLDASDLEIDNKYNTRKYAGFPPGAISNPGIEAINAAFYPDSTNYYYFLTRTDGETVYSRTEYEHNNAKDKARAEGKLAS